MTGDVYVQSVIGHVPRWLPLRDQIAMELRSHIAERIAHGQPLDQVLRQLGDPLTLAESYLGAVPLESARISSRVIAKLIDWVSVLALVLLAAGLLWLVLPRGAGYLLPMVCVFGFVFGIVIYTALAEYRRGGTIGKRVMGIRVVRESGASISLGQGFLRQLPYLGQFFFIDALFVFFTDRRQRAFELLTKTRAVVILLFVLLLAPIPSDANSWSPETGGAAQAKTAEGVDVGAPPGRLVDIGGRKLRLYCTGAGSPTVILEAGASSFAVDWGLVQPEVARTNRVRSYDRAGMGWSEAGEPERADRVVRDLHALLQSAGERPPYVLVGASRGGIYTRIYQRRYPVDVVALVQVDPSHEGGLFTMVNGRAATIASLTPEELMSSIPQGMPQRPPLRNPQTGAPFDRLPPSLYQIRVEFERRLIAMVANATITRDLVVDIIQGEHAALAELLEASRASERPLGDLPIVVLSRGLNSSPDQRALHAALASQSSRGRHQVIDGSYHEIHLSHPSAVVAAIQEVGRQAGRAPVVVNAPAARRASSTRR
jgi:uncharacterized RDD family membrane protein YckC/pimeloyl-ACP methyl ester carboxylesterase